MFPLLLRSLTFSLLLAAGLLAPGWLWGRAWGIRLGIIGGFLGSAALLFNLILLLDACGIGLDASHLAVSLAVVCAALAAFARLRFKKSTEPPDVASEKTDSRLGTAAALLLPAAIALIAIIARAVLNPLSGFDTLFRWDFLAQQMLREHTLAFYPAVTAADFLHYGWCDGIAPLVSSLYAWAYVSAGEIVPWATAPVVILQAIVLFCCVYHLAALRGGAAAGAAAVAFAATSAILPWGIAMGQETGLTAISVTAMFLFIERHFTGAERGALIVAGVAAGVGALAREYGLAFFALGAFALAWRRASPRDWIHFSIAFAAVALPWYLRNWVKTGNPLYSHELGGLFPGNALNAEYFRVVAHLRGFGTDASRLGDLASLLGRLAGLPLVLGLAAMIGRWRDLLPWLVASVVITALWLWSIPQTSGGATYSLRVLTPVLALAAGGAGLWLARASSRVLAIALVLLTALALDAGYRSLYFPTDPYVAWWRVRANAWRDQSNVAAWWNHHPYWTELATAAAGEQILVTDPYSHALLTRRGAKAVPLFSPAVHELFQPHLDFRACIHRLRLQGFRFALLPRLNEINDALLARYPFFTALQRERPAAEPLLLTVYDLAQIDSAHVP